MFIFLKNVTELCLLLHKLHDSGHCGKCILHMVKRAHQGQFSHYFLWSWGTYNSMIYHPTGEKFVNIMWCIYVPGLGNQMLLLLDVILAAIPFSQLTWKMILALEFLWTVYLHNFHNKYNYFTVQNGTYTIIQSQN